jgi:spore coat protein W
LSDNKKNLEQISSSLAKLFILDAFNKHNVSSEHRRQLSDDEKQQLKALVGNLQNQVNEFLEKQNQPKIAKASKTPEPPKNTTLRDMLKNRKKS